MVKVRALGARDSGFESQVPDLCGYSTMAVRKFSKLDIRVRFPLPALPL